ncbi:MAG: cytochrome c family protein [Gammaproteobacteria bacterium HGW-Gammaproteobacteria-2]|jgi:mono/diheme cytochrome c family protein|nr:MAG: cytochrome c family protein [Gammaproteobacteria bacterium HGW-Gammaproteobacteria-2]
MTFITRKSIVTGFIVVIAVLAALAGFVWSGVYNIGADEPHSGPMHAVLETLRERSIAVRADTLQVPDLSDPARIRQGAGNYDAMCVGCHLAPDGEATELSAGLYPAPPNLSKVTIEAASTFWVIKHGIKASGMPAWGRQMSDEYLWNLVAFVQRLPNLDANGYATLVASSEGHSHGGGETGPHDEDAPHQHQEMPMDAADPQPASVEHRHADGTIESHPVPPATPAEAEHEHDHDH